MTTSIRIPFAAVLALLATVAHAEAQQFRTAVGYGGGGVYVTPLNAGGDGPSDELLLDAGWITSAEIEHRVGSGWLGLRAHGGYTQRPFALEDRTLGINVWLADVGLVLRPFGPGPMRGISPFLSAGGGVVFYRFGRGDAVDLAAANARYPGDNERQWAAVAGVGIDVGPALDIQETPLGFRIEVADHIALQSPFDPIAGSPFAPVHNLRITVSLISMIGELARSR